MSVVVEDQILMNLENHHWQVQVLEKMFEFGFGEMLFVEVPCGKPEVALPLAIQMLVAGTAVEDLARKRDWIDRFLTCQC